MLLSFHLFRLVSFLASTIIPFYRQPKPFGRQFDFTGKTSFHSLCRLHPNKKKPIELNSLSIAMCIQCLLEYNLSSINQHIVGISSMVQFVFIIVITTAYCVNNSNFEQCFFFLFFFWLARSFLAVVVCPEYDLRFCLFLFKSPVATKYGYRTNEISACVIYIPDILPEKGYERKVMVDLTITYAI